MDTLKAIIIEDEKNGQQTLASLFELYCPQVKLAWMADDVKSGIAQIERHRPDLIFLDIILGKENGFDILEKLQPIDFQIIFTTSLENYALRAFKASAVDYLLKPIAPNELVKAVHKAEKLIGSNILQNKWGDLFQNLQHQKIERISIPSQNNGTSILEVDKIIFIKGDGAWSTFHTSEGLQLTASKNLGHFCSILPEKEFYRTHQSYLVNTKYVRRVIKNNGMVELSNGVQVPLARSRGEGLMAHLGL